MIQDEIRTKNFVKRIRQLPTLPTVAKSLKELIKKPTSSSLDIARVIEKDQSLSVRVLRIVNSAYYSPAKEITSIKQAVTMIGFKELNAMVLAASVFESIMGEGTFGFNRAAFWEHSLGCAVFSQAIAKTLNYPKSEDAFTSGLMHDIGKVVLDRFFQTEMSKIQELLKNRPMLFIEAEREVTGIDHTLIGVWLLEHWEIPSIIQAAVKHHHQAFTEREGLSDSKDLIADIVHMADIMCYNLNVGDGGNRAPAALNAEHHRRISLPDETLQDIIEGCKNQIEKSKLSLS